jgi:hypothetical protein
VVFVKDTRSDRTEQTTEVVKASELQERVIARIAEARDREGHKARMVKYKRDLAAFRRRRGKRPLQVWARDIFFGTQGDPSELKPDQESEAYRQALREKNPRHTLVFGVVVEAYGQQVRLQMPERPKPRAWSYGSYERFMGSTSHAQQHGLLANPAFNREIRPQRVEEYAKTMEAGEWHDLLSDPITITSDGHVLNGQHRLAAASGVDWSKAENDPLFLVVWNVDPHEALYADGSRRTPNDEKTIASKLIAGKAAA